MVSILCYGLDNPGSNPGHGIRLESTEDTFEHNSRGEVFSQYLGL